MDVQELISGTRDAVSVRRVYGEPYEKDGLTVIPAATVRGGGGAGQDEKKDGQASTGGGFGLVARPTGAWIIEEGRVTWKPAVDVNRVVAGGQAVGLTALVVGGRLLAARQRRHKARLRHLRHGQLGVGSLARARRSRPHRSRLH